MPVITTSVPVGLPGTVLNLAGAIDINTGVFNPALMPTAFGAPVKLNSAGLVSKIEASDTASVFWGLLAASDVQNSGGAVFNSFGYPAPNVDQPANVMLEGYLVVACTVGTPVKGGNVYMRVVADTGKAVGDLEADADGSNSVLLTSVKWNVNGKDATTKATVVRINK